MKPSDILRKDMRMREKSKGGKVEGGGGEKRWIKEAMLAVILALYIYVYFYFCLFIFAINNAMHFRSRQPDFLLDILQRQGTNQALPWLADLVESNEGKPAVKDILTKECRWFLALKKISTRSWHCSCFYTYKINREVKSSFTSVTTNPEELEILKQAVSRVSDPDPQDPHVFALPGSGFA